MKAAAFQFYDQQSAEPDLRAELIRGLAQRPRSIPPKFFYDRRGSELFDAICRLPEYYLTRVEIEILKTRAREIARLIGPGAVLIELGSGAAEKVRPLLNALRPAGYLGIDISREFLLAATRCLAQDFPWLAVHAACADFSFPLQLRYPPPGVRRLVFFPGSSIGNFTPDESVAFLQNQRELVGPHGAFVLGVDLKKDPRILHAAYNDGAGVTAAFNLNLLSRLKREFGADLDIGGFAHEAFYNEELGRIEMYLISRRAQSLCIGGQDFRLERGERLHTEYSYKYTAVEFQALARRAGYAPIAMWTDPGERFSVHYLGVAAPETAF